MEVDKQLIMKDFKKTLHSEATSIRGKIENHVRT